MTIAVLLACLATPNLDACLKNVFHGAGPHVIAAQEQHRAGQPWPHVVIFKLGDGVCQQTRYRDGTMTIACVG